MLEYLNQVQGRLPASARSAPASTPSSAEGPQVSEADKEAFKATLPVYRK